jgi:hypothetical protein
VSNGYPSGLIYRQPDYALYSASLRPMLFAIFSRRLALVCLLFSLSYALNAATISGSVKDSSGAVIPDATVEIIAAGGSVVRLASDAKGGFASEDLSPGTYQVKVHSKGFEDLAKAVELGSNAVLLDLQLTIAGTREEVTVGAKVSAYANSDPIYQALRTNGLGRSFALKANATMDYDVGRFVFRRGTITFLAPVQGQIVGAVFIGEGHFTLTPLMPIDKRNYVVEPARTLLTRLQVCCVSFQQWREPSFSPVNNRRGRTSARSTGRLFGMGKNGPPPA